MSLRNLLQPLRESKPVPVSPAAAEGEIILLADTSRPTRVGLWVLGLGFGGFLLWAGLAPLDEGVPVGGVVTIDTKHKLVQHPTGGIVREVMVKEGSEVRADQPLIRLDDAVARANFESVRQHYLTVRAMEGRLQAEQSGLPKIAFHEDVLQAGEDAQLRQHMQNQEELFRSRRQALQAEMQANVEAIRGQEGAIQGYQGMLASRRQQLDLLREELAGIRDLVKDGYAPRSRQMELERAAAEASASMADLQGNIQRAHSSIAELKMRAIQRQQEYRKEVDTQLADVRREVQADAEKLKAAREELERTLIRSPGDGQVVGLTVASAGGVVQPAQTVMNIVPKDAQLLLEAKLSPHLIDRVQAGLLADVRFSAFAHSPQLVVEGQVESVAGDLLTDPETRLPYYLTRVAVTARGLAELRGRQLQSGMPAEVVIKTGERTLLTYLLHPLVKRLAASMKEE